MSGFRKEVVWMKKYARTHSCTYGRRTKDCHNSSLWAICAQVSLKLFPVYLSQILQIWQFLYDCDDLHSSNEIKIVWVTHNTITTIWFYFIDWNFERHEPNGGTDYNCANFYPPDFRWVDAPCYVSARPICELTNRYASAALLDKPLSGFVFCHLNSSYFKICKFASMKPRLLISHAGYAPIGFYLFSYLLYNVAIDVHIQV